ncbi:hypothetical protein EXIGLDRAFT_828364 [Exidia glandulosa HHB12029]|uniref:Uncharacterized protein n=1 Tax=Exidia glandulosa HHB12029 TaxID=1314781 RepID=A0A165QD41_EXIGL|nr:hypothetical protein EXIGLDRAFT_828364 [Exidia glandulosa HHB12029]
MKFQGALSATLLLVPAYHASALPVRVPGISIARKDIVVPDIVRGNATSHDLARAIADAEEQELEKRGLIKFIFGLGLPLLGVSGQTAMAVGGIVEAGFGAAIKCRGAVFTFDCLDAVADTAMAVWDSGFLPNNGIPNNGNPLPAHPDRRALVQYSYDFTHARTGLKASVVHTQHLPLGNHTTIGAMLMARSNASEWAQAYTREYSGTHRVVVTHRRINAATEEGDDNGTLHQLRAVHSTIRTGASKRVEESDEGVVLDYLWNDASQTQWNIDHQSDQSTFASRAGNTMYDTFVDGNNNDIIASCCTVGSFDPAAGEGSFELENEGVMAFGWNNQPFGFNGRAGGWVSGCSTF